MYYELEVTKNGEHYFSTDKRSITTLSKAEIIFHQLEEKFPKGEGYYIRLTRWENIGSEISPKKVPEWNELGHQK